VLFNSFPFLAFFAVLVPVYYLTAHRYRWLLLAAASLFFYSTFRIEFVALLIVVTGVAWAAAPAIERASSTRARQTWLALPVALIIGTLAIARLVPAAGLIAGVGLSFYSLSAVSYLVDVYRRTLAAERHPGYLLLYLAFFPKLLAGPIERARPFLDRLRTPVGFDADRVAAGLQLVLWGLVKKVVIADRLAPFVDAAYRQPQFAPPADLVLATYFFAFQIYCDFSGYSDIAIGTARVLGFDLIENFRRPYLSASVAEFWSARWHVSLARWFRDYVYIPLGGSRVPRIRHALNVFAVFLLSGLWHGTTWTFLAWGGMNGLYVAAATALRRRAPSPARLDARRIAGALATFHLVLVTWVFFRAATFADALTVIDRTGRAAPQLPSLLRVRLADPDILLSLAVIGVLIAVELADEGRSIWDRLGDRPIALRWAVYYALLAGLVVLGSWNLTQFVYMQF
jgi:D-alanyl-lipoteichoic acid acyltransferase DltB (MBOAT superfamily)